MTTAAIATQLGKNRHHLAGETDRRNLTDASHLDFDSGGISSLIAGGDRRDPVGERCDESRIVDAYDSLRLTFEPDLMSEIVRTAVGKLSGHHQLQSSVLALQCTTGTGLTIVEPQPKRRFRRESRAMHQSDQSDRQTQQRNTTKATGTRPCLFPGLGLLAKV